MTARVELLRRKEICHALKVDRHTLARIAANDPDFPRFWQIAPGIDVIEREQLDAWLRVKKVQSITAAPVAPRNAKKRHQID